MRAILIQSLLFAQSLGHATSAQPRRDNPRSGRKLRPQKGSGLARCGSGNPGCRRGGVKSHGRKSGSEGQALSLPKGWAAKAWAEALLSRPELAPTLAAAPPAQTRLAKAWLDARFPGGGLVLVLCRDRRSAGGLAALGRVRLCHAAPGSARALERAIACSGVLLLP